MSHEEVEFSRHHGDIFNRELPDELRLRTHFGALLAGDAQWAQKVLQGIESTAYEEIDCVGLQPDQSALYATIAIKQDTGYGGELCTGPGNREYVRFFADWDGDGDFTDATEDLGVASVAVYDIPGPKPLSYTVAITVPDHRRLCFLAGPVAVRAVLMYGSVPPPGNPNPNIHWGNVVDVHVQPQTRQLVLRDILEQEKVHLPAHLLALVDPHAQVAGPKVATPVEHLVHTYGGDVPLHRSLAPAINTVMQQLSHNAGISTKLVSNFASLVSDKLLSEIDIDDIVGKYVSTDGDTSFEQLHCVGMSQDLSAVVGVLTLKRANGYSGGLCSSGSFENVAFWADWDDNGSFDEYLGTATVRVHDEAIPAGGVSYAVYLPVNLTARRQPCDAGHTARIRAVLSWNSLPSTTNPYAAPVWGNAIEANVALPLGDPIVGQVPFLSVVGGMAVLDIDGAGLANGTAVMAGFHAVDAPFAGNVVLAGHISNPPDLSAGQPALTYRLAYRHELEPVGTAHEITNAFPVTLTSYSASTWTQTHVSQVADPLTHRYTYREDLTSNGPSGDLTFIEGFVVGNWLTGALPDGRYEVWMIADIAGSPVSSNHVWVALDNTAPDATLVGDAAHIFVPQGGNVTGTFSASDAHLSSWSLDVEPSFPNLVSPHSGSGTVPLGTPFTLSTATATPSGYVLYLTVADRAIVSSSYIGQIARLPFGFCVEKP